MGLGYTYTSKAVAQHALAIRFPDAVALTQPAKGMLATEW